MQARGLAVAPHRDMTVFYQGKPVGGVKLGHMQIEDKIMLFPVAVREGQRLEPENMRLWMESQGISLGILANFATAYLVPEFMKITEFRK